MFVWANEQTAVRESLSHHLCVANLPVSLCVSEFDCAAEEKRVQDLKVAVKIKAALLSLNQQDFHVCLFYLGRRQMKFTPSS